MAAHDGGGARLYSARPRQEPPVEQRASRLDRPVDPVHDHVLGPADAPMTLVEYGS